MLMRTTLTLDTDVMRLARKRAAEENRPLKEIVNEALRQGLMGSGQQSPKRYKFRLTTVKGRTMPGVDIDDRDKLFDLLDGR